MKRRIVSILALLVAMAMFCGIFVACAPDEPKDPVTYTVTFDANGGTLEGNATVKVKEGGKITNAPTAAKEGFTFEGWFTAKTDGTAIDLSTYVVNADVTLYAQYKEEETPQPKEYTVTFDANGGTLAGNATVKVEEGGKIAGAPTASMAGSTFDGWFTAKTGGDKVDLSTYTVSADVTLYAHYSVQIKEYTVTFDANGGTLEGNATVKVKEGGKIENAPVASLEGSPFGGWFTAKTGGDKVDLSTYTVSADVTLYAQYMGDTGMAVAAISGGYRIEAENALVEGEISGNDGTKTSFVEENIAAASGNKSVGYLGVVGNTVTFKFYADKAGKAEIKFLMSSNNTQMDFTQGFLIWVEDQVVTTSDITVALNGTDIAFEPATLRGAGAEEPMTWNKYFDPLSLGQCDLVAGLNTVVITVQATTVPNLDCMDVMTDSIVISQTGVGGGTAPAPADVTYDGDISYDIVVGGYEGGPAIEKVIVKFDDPVSADSLKANSFTLKNGTATVGGNNQTVYLCDENGNETEDATSLYAAVEYEVSYGMWSFNNNLSPFTYQQSNSHNVWNDMSKYTLTVAKGLVIGGEEYTKYANVAYGDTLVPCMADWRTDGKFSDEITWNEEARTVELTYGAYEPAALKADDVKNALIIWLHGGGEGGTDPSVAILGNQVTQLSGDHIQTFFKTGGAAGAYVLAPQTPTYWMDIGDGKQASSPEASVYTESLYKLITTYVTENGDIDMDRIYLGGCSNGGWMTFDLLFKHGEYFAAAYPVSAPYDTKYITDEMIESIKDIPMWITQAKADGTIPVTEAGQGWGTRGDFLNINANYVYTELLKAGAKNVWYSLFDKVTVDGVTYDGHWSWIYTLRDDCKYVQATEGADGAAFTIADLDVNSKLTVKIDGKDATIWQWLAAQSKPADEA